MPPKTACGSKSVIAVMSAARLLFPHEQTFAGAKTGREQLQQGSPLFDHLVGAQEERVGKGKADGFGSLEIDNEFKFRGQLNGQVGGSCAFENPVDIAGRATIRIGNARSVTDHPSVIDVFALSVDRRES